MLPTSPATGQDPSALAHVVTRFSALREQVRPHQGESLADSVVRTSLEALPTARWSSITILQGGGFTSMAVSDPTAGRLDALQYETAQGPCLEAVVDHTVLLSEDLAHEDRWPLFTARALALGARSVLAYRLILLGDDPASAALNVYADAVDAFDDEAVATGLLLATHAALVVSLSLSRDKEEQLEAALLSNRVISLAMGVLMGRHQVTQEQAFDLLRLASQNTNRKVSDIADHVATTGELPSFRLPRRNEGAARQPVGLQRSHRHG